MSLFTSQLNVHHAQGIDRPSAARKRLVLLRLFVNFLYAVMVGSKRAGGFDAIYDGEAGAKGAQTVTFATSSGTVGILISNVTITVTWATSDILSMTALVAAINASVNPLVQYQVQATNIRSQVTLASVVAGNVLRLGAFDFTAQASAALCANWGDFDCSGTDTVDAAALALAINSHPLASKFWCATSAAAVVSVFLISTPTQADGSTSTAMLTTAATIAIAAQPAAAAVGCVVSYKRDRVVNAITTVATGTNVTVGGARLALAAGGNAVPFQEAV